MIRLFFILTVCLSLTSCFEILEQVTVNDNGTGSVKLILNMSQSKTKLKSVMLMDKVNGHKVPKVADIKHEIAKVEQIAKQTKGISNVKSISDFNQFILTFSCDFSSTEALNTLVYNIRKSKDKNSFTKEDYVVYNKTKKEVNRNFSFVWGNDYNKLNKEDKEVFKDAKYIAIYKYESAVSSVSNPKAKVSPNRKATMLRLSVMDVINETSTVKNRTSLN